MDENKKTNKKVFSDLIRKNPTAFAAICVAAVSLVIAIFCLILIGAESHNVLNFYPDGNGNYIVAVGDAKHLSEIVIPKRYKFGKVVAIDDEGFANCEKLTKIVIPDSVVAISDGAFADCTQLETVCYSGNEAQKNKLTGGYADYCFETAVWEIAENNSAIFNNKSKLI